MTWTTPLVESLTRAQELLRAAHAVVALTGAGISTPSGIPDFRSPGSGVWERVDPYEVASLRGFKRRPEAFYHWVRRLLYLIDAAQPNPAHYALAEMEARGQLRAIITQNIDGLHAAAGSRQVIELHGHLRTATCIRCYRSVPGAQVLAAVRENTAVPCCETCGGVLKPDVTLFDEQPPVPAVYAAVHAVRHCDLILVVGSSLVVEPAASLPVAALHLGARMILVNLQPTHLDSYADVVIQADVADILPRLATAQGS